MTNRSSATHILPGVVVIPGDKGGFVYQIQASAVNTDAGHDVRRQLEDIIEPISGAVSITRYEVVKDASGHTQSYKVWVEKIGLVSPGQNFKVSRSVIELRSKRWFRRRLW